MNKCLFSLMCVKFKQTTIGTIDGNRKPAKRVVWPANRVMLHQTLLVRSKKLLNQVSRPFMIIA